MGHTGRLATLDRQRSTSEIDLTGILSQRAIFARQGGAESPREV